MVTDLHNKLDWIYNHLEDGHARDGVILMALIEVGEAAHCEWPRPLAGILDYVCAESKLSISVHQSLLPDLRDM